jgi:hypothetical protein
VGAQVVGWIKAYGQWVMMFVLYFSAENLATLIVIHRARASRMQKVSSYGAWKNAFLQRTSYQRTVTLIYNPHFQRSVKLKRRTALQSLDCCHMGILQTLNDTASDCKYIRKVFLHSSIRSFCDMGR